MTGRPRQTVPQASALFDSLLSLGLVEAWQFSDYGAFSSGGVRLGNLNLEVMGADPSVIPTPSYVTFEPVRAAGHGLRPGSHGECPLWWWIPDLLARRAGDERPEGADGVRGDPAARPRGQGGPRHARGTLVRMLSAVAVQTKRLGSSL